MKTSHDRLLSECFQHLWNTYPRLRRTFFHVKNEIRPHKDESQHAFLIRKNLDKATGIVAGVYDLLFYYQSVLYCFDIKVGYDRLSDAQVEFSHAIEMQGGKCFEIRSLEQFIAIVEKIIII